jgi:hypothetical protein
MKASFRYAKLKSSVISAMGLQSLTGKSMVFLSLSFFCQYCAASS